MDNKKILAFGTCLMLTATADAAPATSTVTDVNQLIASNGDVVVSDTFGISALNQNNFIYAGDVSVTQALNTPVNARGVGISIFNSIMQLGKTDLVVNFADGATGSSYISGIRLKNGSTSLLPAELAQTVTAEFGAGSTITINGNNNTELLGVNIEAGPYHINGGGNALIPEMTAYLNENTTVTLNKAGNYSVGLHAYISGAKIKAKDGLIVNVNTENNSTIYGVRAQGLSSGSYGGGVIELDGVTAINMVNGGAGTTGILAHLNGASITGLKQISVRNTTSDSTAAIYGIWSNGGTIDLKGSTNVTLEGGLETSSAIIASSGGSLTLAGGAISAEGARAFYAAGQNSILTGNAGQYSINGNLLSASGGVLDLTMTDSSVFTGTSQIGDIPGTTNLSLSGENSVWNMTGDSTLTNLTLDGATIKYSAPLLASTVPTAKTLTVTGNYIGNNGTLVLNSVLAGDASLTDKLVVNGDTSGHTNVAINNLGGQGAQTIQGIEIVQVGGNSAGTFSNSGRIVAGAFDYFVRSGSTIAGAEANNWYLVSDITPPDVENPNPEPEENVTPAYRPEAGSYLANLAAANTLFMTTLHDRLGETQYTDALTGEQKVTSMWMRHVGGHNSFRDSSRQLKTTSNRYVMQLGGDLAQWSSDGLDRWHLGAMAGYANSQSNTSSSSKDRSSTGKVDGYSAGLYGTWYANDQDKTGLYVDTWVLYNWFDNEVKGNGLETESYKSRGVTASIESGYSFLLGGDQQASYWLQPKAQVVWMGVDANDRRENNGTRIQDDTDSNLMTRLGLRAYMNGYSKIDQGKDRQFQPFIEANWIHNTENYTVIMDDTSISQKGAKNIGELKLGVEGKLSNNLNIWGNVSQQLGLTGDSYSDTQVMLGIKYQF
ncbi:autotransporter outer membrane beta-barrel domain-containing protein [Budvicia aquatica]|uniref:autotransporter outer membrane beta-barrel domain-containing protein n=1 Tax=Budvicia aquatica TaxID=82979 RepID=UPI002085856D|nr:autotransporter outer membrane beta-barrel domain-containing protein [Budvicia aquatica]GKX53327.1 hypothetical protein SOASR029_36360 [Budvicia aquatica]